MHREGQSSARAFLYLLEAGAPLEACLALPCPPCLPCMSPVTQLANNLVSTLFLCAWRLLWFSVLLQGYSV